MLHYLGLHSLLHILIIIIRENHLILFLESEAVYSVTRNQPGF